MFSLWRTLRPKIDLIHIMCGTWICAVHPPLLGIPLFKVEEKARAGHFFVCNVIGKLDMMYEGLLHLT